MATGADIHSLLEMFDSESISSLAMQLSGSVYQRKSSSVRSKELLMAHFLSDFWTRSSQTFFRLFEIYCAAADSGALLSLPVGVLFKYLSS